MASTLAELIVVVGADVSNYVSGLGKMSRQLATVGAQLEQVGTRMTAALTLPLAGLAVAALKAGGALESDTLAFTTMLKSGDAAKAMLSKLADLAAESPFEMKDTVTGARRLLAMGTAAADVVPTLRSISTAVSAAGGGADIFQRVTLAIGQMSAKGKVSAEEMRQLTEAGINGWQFLADSMGKSVAEVQKMATAGAISASTGTAAILAGINKNFAGSLEAQSQSFNGQMSMISDNFGRTMAEVGKALIPVTKDIIKHLQPVLDSVRVLAEKFGALPLPVQNVAIGLAALTAAIGPLVLVSGALVRSSGEIMGLVRTLGTMGALVPILTGVGYAVAAVAAGFALWKLGQWAMQFEPVKLVITSVGSVLKGLAQIVIGIGAVVFTVAKKIAETVWAIASGIGKAIGTLFGGVFEAVTYFIGNVLRLAGEALQWVAKVTGAEATFNKITAAVSHLTDGTTKAVAAFFDFDKAKTPIETTGAAVDGLKEKTKHFKNEILNTIIALAAYNKAQADIVDQGPFLPHLTQMQARMRQIADEMPELGASMAVMGKVAQAPLIDLEKAPLSVAESYKYLGIVSLQELQRLAVITKQAFEAILHSSTSSWQKITEAAIAAGKAQAAVAAAMGEDVTVAMAEIAGAQAQVDQMNGKVAVSTQVAAKKMSHAMQQVSTIVTDLSKGIADAIVHFKGFGDVAKKIVQELASAIIRDLIEGALAKLGTKLTSIGGMWGKLGGILGGGSSGGGGGAGSAAGAAGGAGGSIGSIGSAAGNSASAIVGAVGSVVSAISGVIGNFQMAHMNTALGRIEENTRFTQIALIGPGGVLNRLNTFLPFLQGIEQRVMGIREALFDPVAKDLEGIYNRIGGGSGGGAAVVNNFYGVTDPREMSEKIVASMRLAGVRV